MSLPESSFLPSKVRHALGAALLGLLLLVIPALMSCAGAGCLQSTARPAAQPEEVAHLLFAPTASAEPGVALVQLSRGRRYELRFANQPNEDVDATGHWSAVWPIPFLGSLGARRLASFRVMDAASDHALTQWIHLVEWPGEHDAAGTFTVPEDTVVRLAPHKVYEISSFTLRKSYEAQATMHRYRQVLTQILRRYGGAYPRTLLDLRLHDAEGRLIEWASLDDRDKLLDDPAWQKRALPLRREAMQSSDSVLTTFVAPTPPE